MEIEKKKCSLLEHKDFNSNIYCGECRIYMCNKCENFHSKLFPNHQTFNTEKDDVEIFTGYCQEKEHQIKLEYFCKTHNQLCCAACIAKIRKKENGKHNDCAVCVIEEIKEEKKSKIKENIKYLEELSNTVEKSVNDLKNIFISINEKKEEIKMKIQKIFTKLRNELNNREDKLLLEVDEHFNGKHFNENLIKKYENLPDKINISLEKAKITDKEENDNNNILLFINDCINIENNIKNIKDINENIKNSKELINEKIIFIPEDEESINKFLENIKYFGRLENNNFIEINNPWTSDRFKYSSDKFYYTLKENNYVAEKTVNDGYIHLIKSNYEFKKNKIYKLQFIPTIIKNGDFNIGFADFTKSNSREYMKYPGNIALTEDGLFINGKKYSKERIENGKKYEFIIDMPQKYFILKIDEKEVEKSNFDFEGKVFAHAAIRNIGNSIRIKTYEKDTL